MVTWREWKDPSWMNTPETRSFKVQDKSQSLQNFSSAAIPAGGKHWLETHVTVPDIFPTNHYHTPSSSHLRFQRKILRTWPKPGNVGFCTTKEGLEISYLWHAPEQPGLWALIFKFRWNKYKKNSFKWVLHLLEALKRMKSFWDNFLFSISIVSSLELWYNFFNFSRTRISSCT